MTLTAKNASTVRTNFDRFENFPAVGQAIGPRTIVALWDDTTDGHLVASTLAGMGLNIWVPNNFVVTRVDIDVLVVPIGPTNMFVSLENDADLVTSAAISGTPWSTTSLKTGAQVGVPGTSYTSAATAYNVTPVRTTASREIVVGGSVAASSAGRVAIYVTGFEAFSTVQGGG